ncbi:MAG: polysaccharide deacetylase family protein [Roseibium sp.]
MLRATRLGSALAPFTQGCGAVFMLHHVRPARLDAFQPNRHLEITPEFLRLAIEQIRSNGYEIISLDEAVTRLKSGYSHHRYAVLTFDDGYRDNLKIAYPILRELQAPFTVFVASGLVDRETELWWLALERIVAENDEIHFAQDETSNGIPCRTLSEKEECFQKIIDFISLEVSEKEQREIIRSLTGRYGVDLAELADQQVMTWDEVRQLEADPLVTIGAHTHHHFALARLSPDAAREDIQQGVDRLEAELGQRPKHFAYPYGKAHAVSECVADILRETGFSSAATTLPGVLQSVNARDLMMLPRVSLNGRFQEPAVIDDFLTGAPFALFRAVKWARSGFGIRRGVSRLFPSTR